MTKETFFNKIVIQNKNFQVNFEDLMKYLEKYNNLKNSILKLPYRLLYTHEDNVFFQTTLYYFIF